MFDGKEFGEELTEIIKCYVARAAKPLEDRIVQLEVKNAQLEAEIARVKSATPKYLGVFREGRVYEENSMVTHDGSTWHCNQKTSAPPGNGSASWTLAVKHGERGRDGKDATNAAR
jgi:hypothetical protein